MNLLVSNAHLDDRLSEYFDIQGFIPHKIMPSQPKTISEAGEGGAIIAYTPLQVLPLFEDGRATNSLYRH